MNGPRSALRVVDDPAAGRFEVLVDDEVAGCAEYRLEGEALAFTHTVVEPRFEGQGIGSALARGALDAARERGVAVLPYCPFLRTWVESHPEYVDLVPAGRRSRFSLPTG
ncbi:MAG: N-acetyltransferase [Frankiales bacterium]|nr:N-acetyltransferase [Frankiales bacterium]